MDRIKKLVEIRNIQKKRKPTFLRQEGHKKKKLGSGWRKPKGMHSKLRRMLRGNRPRVEPGYGSPRIVMHLSKDGLQMVVCNTIQQVAALDPKTQAVIIASGLGNRKRVALIQKAEEMKVKVINFDSGKFLSDFEAEQKAKAEKKTQTAKEKAEKLKEKEKKAQEIESKKAKEKEASTAGVDEEKDKEKKELDRMLTKKDAE